MTAAATAGPYEDLARHKKAQKLADACAALEMSSDFVRQKFTRPQWVIVAHFAGVNPPRSEETIDLVIQMLASREELARVAATAYQGLIGLGV